MKDDRKFSAGAYELPEEKAAEQAPMKFTAVGPVTLHNGSPAVHGYFDNTGRFWETPGPFVVPPMDDAARQKFRDEWNAAAQAAVASLRTDRNRNEASASVTAIAAGKVEPGQPVYSQSDGRVRPQYVVTTADAAPMRFTAVERSTRLLKEPGPAIPMGAFVPEYAVQAALVPEEEGGFSIHATQLPGLVSQGETQEEAMANFREAAEAVLEMYVKDYGAIPWTARRSIEGAERVVCLMVRVFIR